MLRVGLTGELGSGKSTVARIFAEHGAIVLSSDEMGRAMMQPGETVYQAIVDHFGPAVLLPDGQLNRPELSRIAFAPSRPRIEELNAIVHPAVIAEQESRLAELARTQPAAIAIVESALIFNTKHAGSAEPWRHRFDQIVLVVAPEEQKIARFVTRSQRVGGSSTLSEQELREEAQRRLAAQQISPELMQQCIVLKNDGSLQQLADRSANLYAYLLQQESVRNA